MKKHTSVLSGIVAGGSAGIVFSILSLFRFNFHHLDSVMNFVAAPVSLMGARLGLSDKLAYPLLILYFALVGFTLSWLLCSKLRIRWLLVMGF